LEEELLVQVERCRDHTFSETFEVGNCGGMIQHQDFKPDYSTRPNQEIPQKW